MHRSRNACPPDSWLRAVCVLPAYADEWSKTYNLSGKPDLRIETSDANIRVTTWDQNTIEAKVITTRYKIGEGGIRSRGAPERRLSRNRSALSASQLQGRVGKASRRRGDSSRCRARAKSTCAPATARSNSAGSRARWICTPATALNLDGVDGKLHATTGDGHIRADGRFDELELKTGDGHVEVRANAGSSLAAAGGSRPATAASRWKFRGTSRPTLTCTPATATSISTCRSRLRARFARTKSAAS